MNIYLSEEKNNPVRLKETLVIAPHMLSKDGIENIRQPYSTGYHPYWSSGWRAGTDSKSEPKISHFECFPFLKVVKSGISIIAFSPSIFTIVPYLAERALKRSRIFVA